MINLEVFSSKTLGPGPASFFKQIYTQFIGGADAFCYNATMEITSHSQEETALVAKRVLSQLPTPQSQRATVLALYGDLGSGKTTFTQYLAKELGIKDYVTSPTFVIEKRYDVGADLASKFRTLIHIDCYRLSKPDELLNLDWREIIEDQYNLVVVEWPERIKELLPANSIKVEFEFISENERRISMKGE